MADFGGLASNERGLFKMAVPGISIANPDTMSGFALQGGGLRRQSTGTSALAQVLD